jgi:hypothetical protein
MGCMWEARGGAGNPRAGNVRAAWAHVWMRETEGKIDYSRGHPFGRPSTSRGISPARSRVAQVKSESILPMLRYDLFFLKKVVTLVLPNHLHGDGRTRWCS